MGRTKGGRTKKQKHKKKLNKMRLSVGQPWPDGISAQIKDEPPASRARKDKAALFLVCVLGVLLCGLTVAAALSGDSELLRQLSDTVKFGLVLMVGWIGGSSGAAPGPRGR